MPATAGDGSGQADGGANKPVQNANGGVVVFIVTVTVAKGAATVVVMWVTPIHEQALEYRTLPEQADA